MNIHEDIPMRKQILATILVLLIFCSSCEVPPTAPSSRATIGSDQTETSVQMESSTEVTEIIIYGDPVMYFDLSKLLKMSDIVIIGTVEEALPVIRIEGVSLGLVKGFPEYYKNVSCYNIRIEQVFKGGFSEGDLLRVDRNGGEVDGIFENYQDLQYPVEGRKYLMFINETDITDKTDYFKYMFEGTYDGFSEIIDDKLYPQELTSIFEAGTPIEDVIERVTEALDGPPPMESD